MSPTLSPPRDLTIPEPGSTTARGVLSLANLITHVSPATDAASAYERAFTDATCVKMVLDWRACA